MSVLALKERLGNKVQGVGVQAPSSITKPPMTNLPNPNYTNMESGVDSLVDDVTDNPSNSAIANPSNVAVDNQSARELDNGLNISLYEPEYPVIESNYLALTTNAIDIITENLKNQPLSFQLFDVVKAPTGGATVFTVPGLTGDEVAKELTGIILDYTTPRAYWSTPEPIEGTPPDCYSPDSVMSVEGKPCSTCLYNTFGSKGMNGSGSKGGDSQAKACKESIQALLLLPDSVIPIIIRIPVTSKVIFQKYMTRLVSRMIPLNGVVTKITLEKATSNGGQPYAKFNFEAVEVLSPEEAGYARAYGMKFSEMLGAGYDVDEVYESSEHHNVHGANVGDAHNPHTPNGVHNT